MRTRRTLSVSVTGCRHPVVIPNSLMAVEPRYTASVLTQKFLDSFTGCDILLCGEEGHPHETEK